MISKIYSSMITIDNETVVKTSKNKDIKLKDLQRFDEFEFENEWYIVTFINETQINVTSTPMRSSEG